MILNFGSGLDKFFLRCFRLGPIFISDDEVFSQNGSGRCKGGIKFGRFKSSLAQKEKVL